MSLDHAFFYKSVNGDRVYDDTSFEHWLKKFFTSGVFLNDLQVIANNDMTVTVGAGYTNIDGKVKIFASETPLIIETAGASYPRIDSIVLERNDTERDILLKVIKGGYSSEPVAHTPVRQDGVYQLVIAQILVNAGAVKITQADITDTRSNTELCGIVAGAVDQIDFSQVQTQFDAYFAQYKKQIATDYTQYNADMETYLDQMAEDFAAWFKGIRNQLDEDAAGHLQNQIDDINAQMELLGGSIVEVTIIDDEGEYNVEGLEVNLVIDGKTYTETIPSEKVVKFTGVLEVGTAKITCVDEAQEINVETSINIPYFGAYETSITLSSGGSYEEWIEAGGLNPSSYESLDALLEDEKAVRTLMTKKDAVDVLTLMSGDNLATIINHRYAAKWINYREYAYSTLSAIGEIKNLMDASGMYGMYITAESKSRPLVPKLTSNNGSDGGVASASTEYSNDYKAYMVFDGVHSGSSGKCWNSATSDSLGSAYLQYKFTIPTIVNRLMIDVTDYKETRVKAFVFKGSNDGSLWDDLVVVNNNTNGTNYYDVPNNSSYLYYRLVITDGIAPTSSALSVSELQFYGYQEGDTLWQPKGLVPSMRGNTAPYGEAFASGEYSTNNESWRAFDNINTENDGWAVAFSSGVYLGYAFISPTCVKEITLKNRNRVADINSPKNFVVEGSNDNSTWDNLGAFENTNNNQDAITRYVLNNNKSYTRYRIKISSVNKGDSTASYVFVNELQFYGWQLEALIPPMTSNTAPMGKVSASHYGDQSADSASYVFNGKITNAYNWYTQGSNDKQWIQYEFEKPQVVTAICVDNSSMTSDSLFSDYVGVLKGSVDGTKWDDLTEITVKKTSTSYIGFVEFENTTAYKYYRLLSTTNNVNYSGYNYVQIDEIILYGTPDYESRTYIYEHGVEVMELDLNGGSISAERLADTVYLPPRTDSQELTACMIKTVNKISFGLYSVLRWAFGSRVNFPNKKWGEIGVTGDASGSLAFVRPFESIPNGTIDVTSINAETTVHANNVSTDYFEFSKWWLE